MLVGYFNLYLVVCGQVEDLKLEWMMGTLKIVPLRSMTWKVGVKEGNLGIMVAFTRV